MLHTAMFDAWAAYDAQALGTAPWRITATAAGEWTLQTRIRRSAMLHTMCWLTVSGPQSALDLQMASVGYDPTDRSTGTTTSAGIVTLPRRRCLTTGISDGSIRQMGMPIPRLPIEEHSAQINDPCIGSLSRYPMARRIHHAEYLGSVGRGDTVCDGLRLAVPADVKLPAADSKPTLKSSGTRLLQFAVDRSPEMVASIGRMARLRRLRQAMCLFAQDVSRRDNHSLDKSEDVLCSFNGVMDAASPRGCQARLRFRCGRSRHSLFIARSSCAELGGPGPALCGLTAQHGSVSGSYFVTPPSRSIFRVTVPQRRGRRNSESVHRHDLFSKQ